MRNKTNSRKAHICSFYTDRAKKQLNKYWCRIEKTLRYED